MKFFIALENIRSLHNIGAIFRSCSFFGVPEVLLVGYSGKTEDHYDRVILHPEILKTSLGAEKDLTIHFIETSAALIAFSKTANLDLIAVEQNERSIPYKTWRTDKDSILVFGNEVEGVSSEVLTAASTILEIPRVGEKSSLNVATACGIVVAQLLN